MKKLLYRDYKEALIFVRNLKLKTRTDWYNYCQGTLIHIPILPDDIPKAPNIVYKDKGWKNWGEWLGTGNISTKQRKYRDYMSAKKFVASLNLKNKKEWVNYCHDNTEHSIKLPIDIPKSPYTVYNNLGWKNWKDWLGL